MFKQIIIFTLWSNLEFKTVILFLEKLVFLELLLMSLMTAVL